MYYLCRWRERYENDTFTYTTFQDYGGISSCNETITREAGEREREREREKRERERERERESQKDRQTERQRQ